MLSMSVYASVCHIGMNSLYTLTTCKVGHIAAKIKTWWHVKCVFTSMKHVYGLHMLIVKDHHWKLLILGNPACPHSDLWFKTAELLSLLAFSMCKASVINLSRLYLTPPAKISVLKLARWSGWTCYWCLLMGFLLLLVWIAWMCSRFLAWNALPVIPTYLAVLAEGFPSQSWQIML